MRLDAFMADALTRYYHNKDPFGVDGDFTTAPEISQLFGEIIGIWAVQKWMNMGSPEQFNLIEIGPGRGTLMADLLRGTKHIEMFHKAMNIHLIETSPILTAKQEEALSDYNIEWYSHLNNIKTDYPTIIIANEFFDALPIRQFKYNGKGWSELYIHERQQVWKNIKNPPLKNTLPSPTFGDIFEYSQAQEEYIDFISRFKGAYLFIDYGYEKSDYGDTLQALYKHKPCDITDNVGQADLTTHIDFEWLGSLMPNKKLKLLTQSNFLKSNGIDIRYNALNNDNLKDGYHRLIDSNQMGHLFKVLEVTD
jgi:NADH dehydrogenase [ubiquinone] 1 alpha subcomplex assembly factor 7